MSGSARRSFIDSAETARASSMPVSQSEEFYIPRGDIVLQVEDVIFRLHQDILETHSGLFRSMSSAPANNKKEEGTDAKAIRLPKGVCSAQSFTTLCRFMYPRKFGVFPEILVRDLDTWETVLEATQALQMADIQDFILSKLEGGNPDVVAQEAVRLLRLATSISHNGLELECLRMLTYRCRPISHTEGATLGGVTTAKIAFIRERVRTLLLSSPTEFRGIILLHNSCHSRAPCQQAILTGVIKNVTAHSEYDSTRGDHDIFKISMYHPRNDPKDPRWDSYNKFRYYDEVCLLCGPIVDELAGSLKKARLDTEIRECIKKFASPNVENTQS